MNSREKKLNIFSLYHSIQGYTENECKKIFSFASQFGEEKKRKRYLLPYHLNVIDELHINENAHSRILTKILQYCSEGGKYDFLQSIIDYIVKTKSKESFKALKINEPIITQEEERIDLWVRDNEYAIIFENKVYNAIDQDAQISRYIEKTIKAKYFPKDIFIVYLSQRGKDPSEQTWGSYKKEFEDRYINLSFQYDILPWLRDVLHRIKPKDTFLLNAISQYIDYLEGFFGLRTIDKKYNMELKKIISKNLNLQGCKNVKEQYETLNMHINDFNDVVSQMEQMKVDSYPQLLEFYAAEWRTEIKKMYPKIKFYDLQNNLCFGFCISKECLGKNVLLYIGLYGSQLFCQAQYEETLPKKQRIIKDSPIMNLSNILDHTPNEDCIWKYYGKEDFEGVFDCFKRALNELLKISQ